MKKVLLSILALFTGVSLYAQVVFNVQSPTNIVGNYDLTYSEPSGGWGSPDLTDPANSVTGELMFVEDGTAGTNPQGNPISREGCNTLINDLTGKIAVVYRNTCEFGAKAFNAQQAGAIAVIILNRDDEVIGIGPGVDGVNVTIPVIFVSSSTGNLIANELNNGVTVTAFIGNKMGLFDNDLGLKKNRILIPSPNTNTSILLQNASDNAQKLGAVIFNYGNNAQNTYSLKGDITFNGNNIYSETVSSSTNLNTADSIYIMLPDFSLASYQDGKYTLTYTIEYPQTDEYDGDNTFSLDFYVHPTIYSYANVVNDSVVTNQGYRTSAATSSFQSCIHFRSPNASLSEMEGVMFSASVNDPGVLTNQEFTIHVSQWDDEFVDINSPEFAALTQFALTEVATTTYTFTSELESVSVYAPLTDINGVPATLQLIDNKRYLVCIETFDPDTFIGYTNLDYEATADTLNQPLSPVISDDGISILGFTGSPAASIGIKFLSSDAIVITSATGSNELCSGSSLVLTSSATSGNQWNLNGTEISGATNQSYTATVGGNYTVTVGGETSTTFVLNEIDCSGLNENNKTLINVYPNPANDVITLSSDELVNFNKVTIIDALGREIYTQNISGNKAQINVSKISNGTYSLVLEGNSNVNVQRIQIK